MLPKLVTSASSANLRSLAQGDGMPLLTYARRMLMREDGQTSLRSQWNAATYISHLE